MLPSLLALLACAPAHIVVPEPDYGHAQATGEPVVVHYPVDLRPAEERRDGGWYTASWPLPLVTHGDANLEPTTLGAVARAARGALDERGVPTAPDAETEVRLYVLRHAGVRDISDAQWTSTLTGGAAGTVGKLVYPAFFVAYSVVRVEVRRPDGLVTRDVTAYAVDRRPVAHTWSWPSAFQKKPSRTAMTEVLASMHTDLGRAIATAVDEARTAPVDRDPPPPPSHSLGRWSQADSFRRNELEPWVAAKYKGERFSLMTGHDTAKGEVVGHIAVPLDTLGYEVGLSERVQWLLDVTVLGVVNQARTGARVQVWEGHDLALSMQASLSTTLVAPPSERYRPSLATVTGQGAGIVSWRPGEITWYARGGWSLIGVRRSFDELPDLEPGRAAAVSAAPGLEVQISATSVFAFELRASGTFQNGNPLALGQLGAFQVIPQVALGLR